MSLLASVLLCLDFSRYCTSPILHYFFFLTCRLSLLSLRLLQFRTFLRDRVCILRTPTRRSTRCRITRTRRTPSTPPYHLDMFRTPGSRSIGKKTCRILLNTPGLGTDSTRIKTGYTVGRGRSRNVCVGGYESCSFFVGGIRAPLMRWMDGPSGDEKLISKTSCRIEHFSHTKWIRRTRERIEWYHPVRCGHFGVSGNPPVFSALVR